MVSSVAKEFVDRVGEVGAYTFDAEHLPERTCHKPDFQLIGCGFATEGMSAFLRNTEDIHYVVNELFPTEAEAIAYNLKYDIMCMKKANFLEACGYPKVPVDPMVGINLLNDNLRPNQLSLRAVMQDKYGEERSTYKEAIRHGPMSTVFEKYALHDAIDEFRVWGDVKPGLVDQGLWDYFIKVLMPVEKAFSDMEIYGIGWDYAGAKKLLRGFQIVRKGLEAEIYAEIGELNIGSGVQLAKRLFEELGYSTRGLEMTPSGDRISVDAKAMDKLAGKFPICKKIRSWRTCTKMIGTYIEPLTRAYMEDHHGRIHPTYWLVSATGRTRCEKPNFQNIPKWLVKQKAFEHLSIRGNVIPAEGRKLIVSDFSQIELRLVGHISQDPVFLNAYLQWNCSLCEASGTHATILHNYPNCGVSEDEGSLQGKKGFWHGLDLHQITTDRVPALGGDRQAGKKANFALVYFATAFLMHYEYPELSRRKWQTAIDQYFEEYRGVHLWHVKMENSLWECGVVSDIFGRKRRILMEHIKRNQKNALNMFINFAPQSSACGMMLYSMVRARDEFIKRGTWEKKVFFSNMVHDEIVAEADNDYVEEAMTVIKYEMEHVVQLRVPVRADIKSMTQWQESKVVA